MAALLHGIGASAVGHFKKPIVTSGRNITKKMNQVTYNYKIKARSEKYHGDELCQMKCKELLKEVGLPNGLLPLKDMQECGYDRERGFVWLKQKKSSTHKFDNIGKWVSYATEVTAYVDEFGKIKKLTGVKVQELFVWFSLIEIWLDDPPTGNITFKILEGFIRTFPVSAFEIEDKKANKDVKKNMNVKEAVGAVEVKQV
ncbi:hypothetical protein RIF29_40511 [Crotalaria pallida]|uniref:Uncharacterized protein n=1 Tax=Crotalaria pallida TaxID=3830 RepID=A0AAN9E693_CROPI